MKQRHVVGRVKRDLSRVKEWRVESVLAACYPGGRSRRGGRGGVPRIESPLSHMVGYLDGGETIVLCGKVRPESMCGDDPGGEPTCPICQKRWAKLQATGARSGSGATE